MIVRFDVFTNLLLVGQFTQSSSPSKDSEYSLKTTALRTTVRLRKKSCPIARQATSIRAMMISFLMAVFP